MNIVYKNDYLEFTFYKDIKVMQGSWIAQDNEHLVYDEQTIKNIMLEGNQVKEKYRPKFYIADERNRLFSYTNEMQVWLAKTLGENYMALGLEKCAILLPKEYIASISTTLTAEEALTMYDSINVNYFSTTEEALEWFVD